MIVRLVMGESRQPRKDHSDRDRARDRDSRDHRSADDRADNRDRRADRGSHAHGQHSERQRDHRGDQPRGREHGRAEHRAEQDGNADRGRDERGSDLRKTDGYDWSKDWICSKCNTMNFSRRNDCHSCQKSRDTSDQPKPKEGTNVLVASGEPCKISIRSHFITLCQNQN